MRDIQASRRERERVLDVDQLLEDLLAASRDAQPNVAVRHVLERTVADPTSVAEALPPTKAELLPLYRSPELTILKVVWAPGMTIDAHDHRMWAAIGVYSGGEDNAFYRRVGGTIANSGGRELRTSDTLLLGPDVIHAVTNPTTAYAGAIHVYGGDLLGTVRSEWDLLTGEERPYDVDALLASFDRANAASSPTA